MRMRGGIFLSIISFLFLLLCVSSSSSPSFAQTNTPTPTATPTNTPTFLAAATPISTAGIVLPLQSQGQTMIWVDRSFSQQNTNVSLVSRVPRKRIAVTYLEVVADAATVVSVTAAGVTFTFTFVAETVDVPQWRSFALPFTSTLEGYVVARQTGTANVTIRTQFTLGR